MTTPIKLFKFTPAWGLPSTSAFCLKLETWLRMAKLPYEPIAADDLRRAPKKKSPWIQDGDVVMGDTELIIAHLMRTRSVDLDARLSAAERAQSLAFRRLVEEHYHQILTYTLFVHDDGWIHTRALFDFLPMPIRGLIRGHIRRAIRTQTYERGMGRHTHDEIVGMAKEDLDALAYRLGDRPYFFGDRPTTLDASLYGHLALTLWSPVESDVRRYAETKSNLVELCHRIAREYYPEQVVPAARAA